MNPTGVFFARVVRRLAINLAATGAMPADTFQVLHES
jgi:hypothetical protein